MLSLATDAMPPFIPEGAHRITISGYSERVGKVRHTYDLGGDELVMVASNRISTFDCIHPTPIPGKGEVLTQMSAFWFRFAETLGIPHHLITADTAEILSRYPALKPHAVTLNGRSMLVKKGSVLQIEAIVRGHITGSGWKDYQRTSYVCSIPLPAGLQNCEKLEEPLFTPSTKAEEGHDENISFKQACAIAGKEIMEEVRKKTLLLFLQARKYAEERGVIIADTKMEWAKMDDGKLMIVDELLTPDCSRFWPADQYAPGRDQPSFDKQYVRDYAAQTGWDKKDPAPPLPEHVVLGTQARYAEAMERLTSAT